MAAKVALATLIGIGLLVVAVAAAHVVLAESSASAAASTTVVADCVYGLGDASTCDGAERRGHLAWNAASWLIGLGLVVAVGRRGKPQRAE
ncbi:MAG TPA: hypothetical protein VMG12_08005 [Polyangiaceae bacterium]|nr:hypothetical protein [Polyangiaceae bacterium]